MLSDGVTAAATMSLSSQRTLREIRQPHDRCPGNTDCGAGWFETVPQAEELLKQTVAVILEERGPDLRYTQTAQERLDPFLESPAE